MNRGNYLRAKEIERRILHIESVLSFLKSINDTSKHILMQEVGFVSDPKTANMVQEDIPFIIQAYENEEENLEKEFERL